MTRSAIGLLLCLSLPLAVAAQERGPWPEPERARLVTSDVALFWDVYDRASDAELADLLRTDYLEAGTQGLRDFIPSRILGPDSLAARVIRERERYETARERSLRVAGMEREIRAAWYALEYLYPYAVFPNVYFVIGRYNSGGTVSRRGVLIGAEMLPDPDQVPTLVVHELVHYQQPPPPEGEYRLISHVIREGAAVFIAELASGRPPASPYMAYGYENEVELWRELSQVLQSENTGGWVYGGPQGERPADLGYFFGYRIVEAYYEAAADKRKAVSEIINVRDFDGFLRESGYDPEGSG